MLGDVCRQSLDHNAGERDGLEARRGLRRREERRTARDLDELAVHDSDASHEVDAVDRQPEASRVVRDEGQRAPRD